MLRHGEQPPKPGPLQLPAGGGGFIMGSPPLVSVDRTRSPLQAHRTITIPQTQVPNEAFRFGNAGNFAAQVRGGNLGGHPVVAGSTLSSRGVSATSSALGELRVGPGVPQIASIASAAAAARAGAQLYDIGSPRSRERGGSINSVTSSAAGGLPLQGIAAQYQNPYGGSGSYSAMVASMPPPMAASAPGDPHARSPNGFEVFNPALRPLSTDRVSSYVPPYPSDPVSPYGEARS